MKKSGQRTSEKLLEIMHSYALTSDIFFEDIIKLLGPRAEIVHGIAFLCLAILLMLTIPFSNYIFALLLITFSLGLIEKDGVAILFGYAASLLYVSLIFWFITAAVHNLMNWV